MERDNYAPGTPCWVDQSSLDVDASVAFYSALFGWEVAPGHPDAGGYRIAMLKNKAVCGFGPQEGPVSAWTTYFATEDVAATATAIRANGGTVLLEPMDVMGMGHMAIAMDPEGAAFGLWQSGTFPGAGLVNEAGTFGWNELWTRKMDQAKAFYPAALGVTTAEDPTGAMPGYTLLNVNDKPVAGAMPIPVEMPARVPAHWAVYFGTEDVDAAAAKVTELGGMVVKEPFDVPGVGRLAMVHGPSRESFGLFAAAPVEATDPA